MTAKTRQWIGTMKITKKVEVMVLAETREEAAALADSGNYEELHDVELLDWQLVGSMEENR